MRQHLGRLRAMLAASLLITVAGPGGEAAASPYPPSTVLNGLQIDWSTYRRSADGSDNWATTWAANGKLYTSWGDGGGFGQNASRLAYVSLGIAELTGSSARTLTGRNLIGGLSPSVARCFRYVTGLLDRRKPYTPRLTFPCRNIGPHGKLFSLLALGNNLYGFMTPGSNGLGFAEGRIYRAAIGTNDWVAAPWAFRRTDPYPLIFPAFVQAGQDHADRSDYIYVYGTRYAPTASPARLSIQKGPRGGEIGLARLPRNADPMVQGNWQYFSGTPANPVWSPSNAASQSVVTDPAGVGFAVSAFFIRQLDRYLLFYQDTALFSGKLTILESAEPWGPWAEAWSGTVANSALRVGANGFFFSLLPNSISGDGRGFTLVFTGTGDQDALNAVDARFGGN